MESVLSACGQWAAWDEGVLQFKDWERGEGNLGHTRRNSRNSSSDLWVLNDSHGDETDRKRAREKATTQHLGNLLTPSQTISDVLFAKV